MFKVVCCRIVIWGKWLNKIKDVNNNTNLFAYGFTLADSFWCICSTPLFSTVLTLSHRQQICSRRLWKHTRNCLETPFKWKYNNWIELKIWWQMEKLLKKSSAAWRRKASIWGKRLNIHAFSFSIFLAICKSKSSTADLSNVWNG